jgi:hypothetical protein
MAKDVSEYRSPPHKVIAFLHKGRDDLRIKYRDVKQKLRTAENQIRAVSRSREAWRERALKAEDELRVEKKREKLL